MEEWENQKEKNEKTITNSEHSDKKSEHESKEQMEENGKEHSQTESKEDSEKGNGLDEKIEQIGKQVPESGRVHAEAILTFMIDKPFWNEKGEILDDQNNVIPDSNIVELLTHAVTKSSKDTPQGILQFYHILANRVPIEFVQNENGLELMIRGRVPYGEQRGKGKLDESPPAKKMKFQNEMYIEHPPKWLTINEDDSMDL